MIGLRRCSSTCCVVAVAVIADGYIGRWPVSIDADGRLIVEVLGLTGEARPAPTRGAAADDDWPLVPPAQEPEKWAEGTGAADGLPGRAAHRR